MKPQSLAPEDLVRRAVVEVTQLTEHKLIVVIEMIDQTIPLLEISRKKET